jgi:hypothetical protein
MCRPLDNEVATRCSICSFFVGVHPKRARRMLMVAGIAF